MTDLDTYPKDIESLARDPYGQPIVCSGCAHSAADAPFPGRPSGERPCCFCTRNVQREEWARNAERDASVERGLLKALSTGSLGQYFKKSALPDKHPARGVWYDGSSAVKVPMDCYHSVDYGLQVNVWLDKTRSSRTRTLEMAARVVERDVDGASAGLIARIAAAIRNLKNLPDRHLTKDDPS